MSPSTEWREQVQAGEEARFEVAAQRLVEIQRARSQRFGNGRALHRKQHLGLAAELEVLGGLPPHAAQGLFAAPGRRGAWVRLSNGGMDVASNRKPDVRGFAIKVRDVTGDGALGQPTTSQDFLLINRSTFGFARPEPFFELVFAASKGVLSVVALFVRTHGFFAGLKKLGELKASQAVPFAGYASEKFFSAAPIACGPYAARVRIVPNPPQPAAIGVDWTEDVRARLDKSPLVYDLQLQFFVDEQKTPIEDGSADWAEADSSYLTVGRLTIPAQQPGSDAGRALDAEVEKAKFDPWSALMAHRPLGAIMRARRVAYFASQKERGAA